jgi:hypothetical protein
MLTTKGLHSAFDGRVGTDVLSAIVPAGGTSAANWYQREIRHVLVLRAALGQAERLAYAYCFFSTGLLKTKVDNIFN